MGFHGRAVSQAGLDQLSPVFPHHAADMEEAVFQGEVQVPGSRAGQVGDLT